MALFHERGDVNRPFPNRSAVRNELVKNGNNMDETRSSSTHERINNAVQSVGLGEGKGGKQGAISFDGNGINGIYENRC